MILYLLRRYLKVGVIAMTSAESVTAKMRNPVRPAKNTAPVVQSNPIHRVVSINFRILRLSRALHLLHRVVTAAFPYPPAVHCCPSAASGFDTSTALHNNADTQKYTETHKQRRCAQ